MSCKYVCLIAKYLHIQSISSVQSMIMNLCDIFNLNVLHIVSHCDGEDIDMDTLFTLCLNC